MRTLIDIINTVCDEVSGLPRLNAIVGSSNQTARQMLALANREGFELARMSGAAQGWPELRKEYVFNVQSTGLIAGCSTTSGSNIITLGSTASVPQVGWLLSVSGGSNATGFSYPATVVSVVGAAVTVSSNSTITTSNVTIAFGQESYSLPADFSYIINDTIWDRGYRWRIVGPATPQEWQILKSGLNPTGPRRRYRMMAKKIYFDPIPYDSNQLVFEYYSNAFCQSQLGVAQTTWLTDLDTPILQDELFVLGIKWRWRQAQGLDYSQEYASYKENCEMLMANATSGRSLPLSGAFQDGLLNYNNIPDTGFGV